MRPNAQTDLTSFVFTLFFTNARFCFVGFIFNLTNKNESRKGSELIFTYILNKL
jgi:hypothetical protein